ncbi:M81 family metallopeptidase [Limobrevibacterium gyesilva]|uniref:Microcystinase C n=1 Tax=Limobrevibacterium gyesilva TaxID=2991712 RepID=A0AA41YSP7_9PROT|nr:M81 family metallopeptidase [Limobrevibacterium gyesilva]MCW3475795.1 M81 family metallopeptidase [Limobrevibacterium gyesilva]
MRIAVGGFMHESHSFAPRPTRYVDFVQPGGFPKLTAGAGLFDAVRGTSVPLAGAITAGAAAGADLVPLAWGFANPAGPVQDEAFERISALICAELSKALDAGPLDGVYLDLHGAAVADSFPDMEGELLRRVRAIVGAIPLTISLDPHCNLTRRMVDLVDVLVPFRTYPHVDMTAAGSQAMALLIERIRRGTPLARAFRQVNFFLPLTTQCTLVEPMLPVMEERAALAARSGVAELAFCFGFPYADFADCGAALAVYADTQDKADAAADAFLAFIDAREATFRLNVVPAAQAVAEAIRIAATAAKPVVIADTQDNPGGGGHGDTTGLLAELVRQGAKGAVMALINDDESAAACHRAGEGARIALMLGGKSDGAPLQVTATVLKLTDGKFVGTGPMAKGNPADLGPSALIEVAPDIRVIVVTRKMQALDQALVRHVGIEPGACKILVLKSSVHFRADFQPISEAVIVAEAPGPVVADPAGLPFKNLRKGLRLRPMDNRAVS